jgi:hypothetical protein
MRRMRAAGPHSLAASRGNDEITKLLAEHGAVPQA